MKANVPEKIYINDFGSELSYDWHTEHCCESDIEYVRKDDFVEKACDWLEKNGCGYWLDDSALPNRDLINDFRKYMEE